METLESNIEQIKSSYIQVLNILNSFNDREFQRQLKKAKGLMDSSKLSREKLRNEYDARELQLYEADLQLLTKQIKEKFDNIVREKTLRKEKIAQQIEWLKNKKKLQNYRR